MRRPTRASAVLLAVVLAGLLAAPAQALTTGTTKRVGLSDRERQSSTGTRYPAVSGNGRYAAFATDQRMAPGDTDGVYDVFLRDLTTGSTELVSWAYFPGGAQDP